MAHMCKSMEEALEQEAKETRLIDIKKVDVKFEIDSERGYGGAHHSRKSAACI